MPGHVITNIGLRVGPRRAALPINSAASVYKGAASIQSLAQNTYGASVVFVWRGITGSLVVGTYGYPPPNAGG